MSFVGTRPEVTKYVKKYTKEMRATLLLHIISNTEFDENIRNQILMCDRNEKIRILSEEEVRDASVDAGHFCKLCLSEFLFFSLGNNGVCHFGNG